MSLTTRGLPIMGVMLNYVPALKKGPAKNCIAGPHEGRR
jgi:hypothetical protein